MELINFKTKENDFGYWRALINSGLLEEITYTILLKPENDHLTYIIPKKGDFWLGFESERNVEFELFFHDCRFAKGTSDKLIVEIPFFLLSHGNIMLRFRKDPGNVRVLFKCTRASLQIPLTRKDCVDLQICGHLCRIENGGIVKVYQD